MGDSMNMGQARRLYKKASDGLNRLETALYAAQEADVLGLDEATERANVSRKFTEAKDALLALANLDPSAGALLAELQTAIAEAGKNLFEVTYLPPEGLDEGETEEFLHPLVLRSLLGRIAAIYELDPAQLEQGLTVAQGQLLTICRNASAAIHSMLSKKLISVPRGEHDVKHLLYAIARASFIDAIPDGGIAFPGQFVNHKPDFGIPSIKCCVETKIARDRTSMSSAIDGIIADQSNYGDDKYKIFIGVIYASDETLTQDMLDDEIASRVEKGGQPNYEWHWVLILGPLEPSKRKSKAQP